MLNTSASLAMSTSILKAMPGKLDIKRHSPSILYICVITRFIMKGLHCTKISLLSCICRTTIFFANTAWQFNNNLKLSEFEVLRMKETTHNLTQIKRYIFVSI